MSLKTLYITNDPDIAAFIDDLGVDVVWIDLEVLGKEERQKNMNTVKSHHTVEDIKLIKPLLKRAKLMVRINPININSKKEINDVIDAGADLIMLPMWSNADEVQYFLNCVDKKAKTILLLETKAAVENIDKVIKLDFDEIHIGLNDLHLSYGLTFMFELLTNGVVEDLCQKFRFHNIKFGLGGIAKLGSGLLKAEKIIIEHYRLGSSTVILSRSFCDFNCYSDLNYFKKEFGANFQQLKDFENRIFNNEQFYNENKNNLKIDINNIVENINKEKCHDDKQ